jgi:peptidoglycan/LPS O-acetylase OafA/YrhL
MKQTTRDNLIYLGVGLAVVAGLVTYMFYGEGTTGTIRDIPGPILWGILSTPGIVGLVLEGFWKYRRRPALWIILAVIAAINISVVTIAYFRGWSPPVLVWSMLTGACMVPIFVLTSKLLGAEGSDPAKHSRRKPPSSPPATGLRGKRRE